MLTITVYLLTFDRARQSVERLIQHFAIRRTACADDFEFPQYAEMPECIYTDDAAILNRLESDKNAAYSLYWNVTESHRQFLVEQVIALYMWDGAVILGMVVPESQDRTILEEFHRTFGIQWGFVTGDEFPAYSALHFQELCRNARLPHILDGTVVACSQNSQFR